MKFLIALVSFWESLGFNTANLRKSADGSKAIVHLEYLEVLKKGLDVNPAVEVYDRINPDFQALLISEEWNGNGLAGMPDSFGALTELSAYEQRLTDLVQQALAKEGYTQAEVDGLLTGLVGLLPRATDMTNLEDGYLVSYDALSDSFILRSNTDLSVDTSQIAGLLPKPINMPVLTDNYVVAYDADTSRFVLKEDATTALSQVSGVLPKPVTMPTLTDGYVVTYDAGTDRFVLEPSTAGGANTFEGLADTPVGYSGQSGKTLIVNETETGLVYSESAGGFEVETTYDYETESFETETRVFPMSSTTSWVRTDAFGHSGFYSLTNTFLTSGTAKEIDFTITVGEPTSLSFWAKRMEKYTNFAVSLNETSLINATSGQNAFDWTQYTTTLVAGVNTLHVSASGANISAGVLFLDDIQVGAVTTRFNQAITEHRGMPDMAGKAGKPLKVNPTADGVVYEAITKAEVEAALTGQISSHSHARTTPTKAEVEAVLTGTIASHTHAHVPDTKAETEAVLTGEIATHTHKGQLPSTVAMPSLTDKDGYLVAYDETANTFVLKKDSAVEGVSGYTILIAHNLNEYPHVRALTWEYGIGMIGLGNETAGLFGGTNVQTVPCSASYLNRQQVEVSLPAGHTLTAPTVTQVNSREWLLTEGTTSLQITLMEA